ncbi:MAG: fructosamine kinase family protein [Methylococcaceae bacterium]
MNVNWQPIISLINSKTQRPFKMQNTTDVGGGCINSAYIIEGDLQSFFVKLNSAALLPMFEAEAAGLEEMATTHTVTVPEPIVTGLTEQQAFIVMEKLNLASSNAHSNRLLGQQLAQLHLLQQDYFGWSMNNTIGSTPQINSEEDDWVSFYRDQRLGYQLALAKQNGFGDKLWDKGQLLRESLTYFFTTYSPHAALLHGDLWSGNAAADTIGNPIIFDPACYYGDHEADLAMTELFGGFGADFFAAYQEVLPIDSGYSVRKTLYNLYHILNHLNLFGSGYLDQAQGMLEQLLAETR